MKYMAKTNRFMKLLDVPTPWDPITETENGLMEPKYYAFCLGDWTPFAPHLRIQLDA